MNIGECLIFPFLALNNNQNNMINNPYTNDNNQINLIKLNIDVRLRDIISVGVIKMIIIDDKNMWEKEEKEEKEEKKINKNDNKEKEIILEKEDNERNIINEENKDGKEENDFIKGNKEKNVKIIDENNVLSKIHESVIILLN